jgi:hypothetical protein
MPLNYNCLPFFEKNIKSRKNNIKNKLIKLYMKFQENTPYKYSYKEILDAAFDPVINHFF